jgi:prepilin-type N-terminal cleavage/methylation domain-containing protein
MKKLMKSQKGFTLIEVAISMAFILFIVQGVAMVSLYSQKSSLHNRRKTSAAMLADEFMERLRNQAYSDLQAAVTNPALFPDTCFDINMNGPAEGVSCPSYFTRSTTITSLVEGGTTIPDIVAVDVTVTWQDSWSWNEQQVGDQEVKLVSYISLN